MNNQFLSNILLIIVGWILGLFQPLAINFIKELRTKRINKKSNEELINYDPSDDKIMLLHSWSFSHNLLPNNTIIHFKEREKKYDYIKDINEFNSISKEFKKQHYCGTIAYMIGYKVDHRDNQHGKKFEMTVAPCDYSEALSVSPYLGKHPEVLPAIVNQVNKNPYKYFDKAIPSDVFINVIVVNESGNILALRRSKAVASAQGLWCIGSFETMEFATINTAKEDKNFHLLTQRCLVEELNLHQKETKDNKEIRCYDFDSMFISSISLSLYHMGTLITSIVKVKGLTDAEITKKITQEAHSKYEHDAVEWLEYDEKQIKEYIEKGTGKFSDFVKKRNSSWIEYTKWSLYELVRVFNFDKV